MTTTSRGRRPAPASARPRSEDLAIHWSVEQHGGDEAGERQAANEGTVFQWPWGTPRGSVGLLAPNRASVPSWSTVRSHRRRPGPWGRARADHRTIAGEPPLRRGAPVHWRAQSFFMRLVVPSEELPNCCPDHPYATLRSKLLYHLVERRVGLLPQGPQDEVLMRIEHRTLGLALFGRPNITLRAFQRPSPHRCYADRKARRRLTCDIPPSSADTTRSRRSRLYGFPIDPSNCPRNQIILPMTRGTPPTLLQGKCSSACCRQNPSNFNKLLGFFFWATKAFP